MQRPAQLDVQSDRGQTTIQHEHRHPQPLCDLLALHGLPLNTRCGRRGLCDGCLVELREGQLLDDTSGAMVSAGATPLSIKACHHALAPGQHAGILIETRSLLSHRPQVVNQFKVRVPFAHDPLWKPPVSAATASATADLGVAIDIGTTTVALLLVDLADGKVLAKASDFNGQMDLGDNVLTRINLCLQDPAMLPRLQKTIARGTIRRLLRDSLAELAARPEQVRVFSIAANTTMLHLLAGVNPGTMGYAPFTAPFLDHRVEYATPLGLFDDPPHRPVEVHLLPSAAAYVGADLTAGVLSTGLAYDEGPCLLVDVGTNGEIILRHGARLLGCATAAGPAFEGAGLKCGVRAGDGAISHLEFHADPAAIEYEMIGAADGMLPIGLCGTAYIDAMAEGRRSGLLTATGRFDAGHDGWAKHLEKKDEHGHVLRVAWGQGKRPIIITEPDLASLLQAKAAIGAGIVTLMHRAGLAAGDIKRLYLAGGFGMHMDVENAIGCGLLPGFKIEQVELVGNTSLAGAYLALLDRGALTEMQRIARGMEIVELNLEPEFESCYIDQLALQ